MNILIKISGNAKYVSAILMGLCLSLQVQAQQIKKAEKGPFLLKNATIHSITKGTFSGDVFIDGEKIKNISQNIPAPQSAKIIDCSGKHVYPGFIDSGTRLGLAEIESISVTNDFAELGDFIPHMKALTAINPNSVSIPVTRVNGVTTVFSKPERNTFPGTGALIDLFGYTPEQMYAGAEAVIMNFPSTGRRGRFDRRTEEEFKKDAEKVIKNINDIWEKVALYARIDSMAKVQNKIPEDYNPQMDALLPVYRGQKKLLVEVNKKEDILVAIKWLREKKIKAVLTGVSEGGRVTEEIKKSNFDVITGPVLSVPGRANAAYDEAYRNVSKMVTAGIKVAIRTNEAENVRNLPFNAGFAANYGLGIEEALKCITINPAQIFEVDKLYGSLEVGKIANLFISDGDPFEPKTRITHLFIRGWDVPLESRQTLLNDEFLERLPGINGE
jgi:imidazolonepropionase-like amidohydrolase